MVRTPVKVPGAGPTTRRMAVGLVGVMLSTACGRIGFEALDGAIGSDADVTADTALDAAVSPFAQRAYLKASNPGAGDLFGDRLALSTDGSTLVIGATLEASGGIGVGATQGDDSAPMAGAAYVFVRSAGSWVQQAYLKASNTDAVDYFGHGVAISDDGSTIAVSAPFEDSNATVIDGNQADDSAINAGAVYVFTRSGTTWTQQAYLKPSSAETGDLFGFTLAMSGSGSRLAVGAMLEDSSAVGVGGATNNGAMDAGAVYVFERVGAVWAQQAYLKASNTDPVDEFGESLALSRDGSTLAVGALQEDGAAAGVGGNQADDTAPDAGAVYVFHHDGLVWSQQGYVKASNPDAGDQFGSYVTLSRDGGTLAVSAKFEASASSGVGGDQADDSAMRAGAVYVYERSATTWSHRAYLKASRPDPGDQFGFCIHLSGDGLRLAVGAINEDSGNLDPGDNSAIDAGAAYVFDRQTTWSQVMYIKPSNLDADDYFGIRVELADDGHTLVIGARNEDSGAKGIDGDATSNAVMDAGAVYVFE